MKIYQKSIVVTRKDNNTVVISLQLSDQMVILKNLTKEEAEKLHFELGEVLR